MLKKINLTKDYIINKPFEESFTQLNKIISSPYNNSTYSTFGNFVSDDPPEFILMTKWFSFGRPMFAEIASTKISAILYKIDNKTKITITTKTNPTIFFFFLIFLSIFFIKIFTYKNFQDIEISAIYLLFAPLTLAFDRFIKNLLIASFERDLYLKTTD